MFDAYVMNVRQPDICHYSHISFVSRGPPNVRTRTTRHSKNLWNVWCGPHLFLRRGMFVDVTNVRRPDVCHYSGINFVSRRPPNVRTRTFRRSKNLWNIQYGPFLFLRRLHQRFDPVHRTFDIAWKSIWTYYPPHSAWSPHSHLYKLSLTTLRYSHPLPASFLPCFLSDEVILEREGVALVLFHLR
jgi:hypothetical protein